jgi:hypothetical protein
MGPSPRTGMPCLAVGSHGSYKLSNFEQAGVSTSRHSQALYCLIASRVCFTVFWTFSHITTKTYQCPKMGSVDERRAPSMCGFEAPEQLGRT